MKLYLAADHSGEIEIPREAYPYLVGYLAGAQPELARSAVAAWRRSEAEFRRLLEAGRTEPAAEPRSQD